MLLKWQDRLATFCIDYKYLKASYIMEGKVPLPRKPYPPEGKLLSGCDGVEQPYSKIVRRKIQIYNSTLPYLTKRK